MRDELISLRILLFSGSAAERDLMRQGAIAAFVPVEVVEAEEGAAARAKITGNDIDVVFADASIPAAERAAFIARTHSMEQRPFVFLLAATAKEAQGLAEARTASSSSRQTLIRRRRWSSDVQRLRLPNRVLVVDDSLTMRNIVRKILVASRFRLEVSEAPEGIDALKQIASGKFDLVFLDYNMPGFNGVEALSEIKRQYPDLHVVIMTSAADDMVAERARRAGAAAFVKKPFYPADIDTILHGIFGLQAQQG
jgi:CheY-like chemotaxis protein